MPESELESIKERLREFVKERDWGQFHNPKDLTIALSIEAGELLEKYLWKEPDALTADDISHELADVLIYAIMLSDKYGIDIFKAIEDKIDHNALKYPAEKAKGRMIKYTNYRTQ